MCDKEILNTYIILDKNKKDSAKNAIEYYKSKWALIAWYEVMIAWNFKYTLLYVTDLWNIRWKKLIIMMNSFYG